MNTLEIRDTLVRALQKIAPESDPMAIDGHADLRDALDLDSMDFLRFVTEIHDRLHVDIPERDYGKVRSLDDCASYLEKKLAA